MVPHLAEIECLGVEARIIAVHFIVARPGLIDADDHPGVALVGLEHHDRFHDVVGSVRDAGHEFAIRCQGADAA